MTRSRRDFVALGLLLVLPLRAVLAQSGRGGLDGWVAFDGVAYVDKQPLATVQLRELPPGDKVIYTTHTDEHGFYHFKQTSLGDFQLHITAPHFKPYDAEVYIPSDFIGNWAILLKPDSGGTDSHRP